MAKQRNKHYKRLDKKGSDSSDDEETELFVRHKSPRLEIPSIEKHIEEGDTLQSLAIRYHCTIEDLKRLNNIHKENEIFARRTIKVPHRPLSEALATIHTSGTSSPTHSNKPMVAKLIDIESIESKLEQAKETTSEVNEIIFNSSISKDLEKPQEEISENIFLIPQQHPPLHDPIISRLSCNGSDWDISYPALIVCIVLVIFAIPLIYVFYIAEHPEIYLNHTHSNGS